MSPPPLPGQKRFPWIFYWIALILIVLVAFAPVGFGRGLGGALLTGAIEEAWRMSPSVTRVWVHTCTLDHPRALANYQSRGMVIYKREAAES